IQFQRQRRQRIEKLDGLPCSKVPGDFARFIRILVQCYCGTRNRAADSRKNGWRLPCDVSRDKYPSGYDDSQPDADSDTTCHRKPGKCLLTICTTGVRIGGLRFRFLERHRRWKCRYGLISAADRLGHGRAALHYLSDLIRDSLDLFVAWVFLRDPNALFE